MNGLGYLAVPNRWRVFEAHYRLPFLSWLPREWANRLVRLFGRGERYDCRLLSRRDLLGLCEEAGLIPKDITLQAMKATLVAGSPGILKRSLHFLSPVLFTLFRPIIPTLVFILRPDSEGTVADR